MKKYYLEISFSLVFALFTLLIIKTIISIIMLIKEVNQIPSDLVIN